MSYKTILTYLSSAERAKALIDVSLAIAGKQEAHLIGLHVIPQVPVYGAVAAQIPQEVVDRQRDVMREDAEVIQKVFEDAVQGSGVRTEWRCEEADYGDLAQDIIEQALCVDLVVAGQETSDWFEGRGDLPARIVMGSGRPVLLVPSEGTFNGVGERVVVAWNQSRESARAAFDAMPLMQDAKSVRVLAVNPGNGQGHNAFSPSEDLALCLSRHGIKTEAASTVTTELSVGDELLSRLADHGSDLLVMGCYGHSRLRETIFGGATRHILKHMTVPVLMSH